MKRFCLYLVWVYKSFKVANISLERLLSISGNFLNFEWIDFRGSEDIDKILTWWSVVFHVTSYFIFCSEYHGSNEIFRTNVFVMWQIVCMNVEKNWSSEHLWDTMDWCRHDNVILSHQKMGKERDCYRKGWILVDSKSLFLKI